MVALALADAPTAPQQADRRRITEHDPALAQLKTRTVRQLTLSVNQLARELRDGVPPEQAQSHFIQRHIALMRAAYEAAHHEGQLDYYGAVSREPRRWANLAPDSATTAQRMAFYAPSVARMAHEAVQAWHQTRAQQVVDAVQTQTKRLADAPSGNALSDWQQGVGARLTLQADLTWSGGQDGYVAAGAADGANPFSKLFWDLEPVAQHCDQCPQMAAQSPYDPPGSGGNELNQTPGDGNTDCGAACRCSLSYGATIAPLATPEPPKPTAPLNAKQQTALDNYRTAGDMWHAVKNADMPDLPRLSWLIENDQLYSPDLYPNIKMTRLLKLTREWWQLTPEQREALFKGEFALFDYQVELGNYTKESMQADSAFMKADRARIAALKALDKATTAAARDKAQKALDKAIAQQAAAKARMDAADAHLRTIPPDAPTDDSSGLREPAHDEVILSNPYPRQKGGLFGFGGPGHGAHVSGATGLAGNRAAAGQSRGAVAGGNKAAAGQARGGAGGGGGGAKAAPKAKAAAKAKAAPKPKAAKAPKADEHKPPTIEEQKKAAEERVKSAKSRLAKATKEQKEAEKAVAEKAITNASEIARLQAEHSAALGRSSDAYGQAREAIKDERVLAKIASGKAPKTVERMQAARQPYEDAKAAHEAAKAISDASKAREQALLDQYVPHHYTPGGQNFNSYTDMMRAHPDLKAASNQAWKDKRVTTRAQNLLYRKQNAYEGPRNTLAGKITDEQISAHPLYVRLKTEEEASRAALDAATGQDRAKAAFTARQTALKEYNVSKLALAHPTWKYPLYSAPTHGAEYSGAEHWPEAKVGEAQRAEDQMRQRIQSGEEARHVGDLALHSLQHSQGFDGKPSIVDEVTLENGIKNGDHELWRGDTKAVHTDNYMLGEYHAGLGIRGNGTYVQEAAHAGISTAKSYATAHGSKDGLMIRMSLKADAKIVNYEALLTEQRLAQQAAHRILQSATSTAAEKSAARRALWLATSEIASGAGASRFAVSRGYDAIRIKSVGQMIVLNRTALKISHQVRPPDADA